jgi:hypothetical protein
MTRIEGRTVLRRPPGAVFDLLADPRNEPAYNPIVRSAEKVSPGPIGPGTRFVQQVRRFGRSGAVTIDLLDHRRPRHLAWSIESTGMTVRGTEDLTAAPEGTEVHWSWDFRPRAAMRLLGPVLGRAGRRLERRVWSGLRRYLEESGARPDDCGA